MRETVWYQFLWVMMTKSMRADLAWRARARLSLKTWGELAVCKDTRKESRALSRLKAA